MCASVEAPAATLRRFTVADFLRMAEVGLFERNGRVELIDGQVLDMSPICSPHAGLTARLTNLFARRLGEAVIVSMQNPLEIDLHGMPQPDLMLLRPRADFYAESHPRPDDVLLLIEVSDSTLRFDKRVKLPLYARGGIAETWIADVPGRTIWISRGPLPAGEYRETTGIGPEQADSFSPLAFPELKLTRADFGW